MDKKQYYASLDGIRAVAIIFVMLLHAHFQLGKGGGIGVQIFFILSGFLITQSLLNQFDKFGFISLKKFWLQRLFRLLPAFLVLLVFVFLVSFIFFKGVRVSFIHLEILNSLFYVYNLSWFWLSDNFERILGHTWSLSVENQFYLLWPILLVKTMRFLNKKKFVFIFSTVIICLSFLKYSSFSPVIFRSIYFEAIYFGCILSILLRNKWITEFDFPFLSLIFFVFLLLIGLFKIDFQGLLFNLNLINLVIPVLSISIILNSLFNPYSYLSILLSFRPLVFIGKISYSLYLWHLPIFRFFALGVIYNPLVNFILKFLITFIIACLSYYFIEKKFINAYKIWVN